VAAAPGTTAVLQVAGSEPAAFRVTDAHRGERLPGVPSDPTVALATDRETFVLLAGGRRRPVNGAVRVTGDQDLGRRLLEHLVVVR
jgi:hypothetical protein